MNGKMLMSPGMSLVVAGVASGICFLIYSGVLRGKSGDSKEDEKQIPVSENRCSCCLKPFFLGRGVRCEDCGGKSCRKGCSRWDPSDNAWHCLFCRQQRYWLKKNGVEAFGGPIDEKDLHRYFNTAKSQVYVAGVENAATSSGQGLATKQEDANTMETVRDFVEKIVVRLMGNLNDTPIHRLYDHPAYKPNTDSPTMAHTALREIVERAVEEARKLPGLGGSGVSGNVPEARNVAEDSYEDILATAILNKVIEKFQKEQVDGNSNVLPGKPVSAKCALSENEAGLDEGVEEGCSSLEPLSQDDCSSDCSASCSRRVRNQPEPLSLTIEERIEEVTTTYASDEDHREHDVLPIKNAHRVPFPELGMDIIDPCQESEDSQDDPDTTTTHIGLVSPIESWEENWLFQKKRVQSQADPVAMLVPNPSADFKALIGDKDAEDTSDLSECSSAQSDEEIEKELMEAISSVVPRSPKKKEFENGLDYLNSSDDFSLKVDDTNSFSNGGYVYVSDEEKTDCRRVKDQRKAEKQREKEEDYKQSVKGNEEVKAKEIKEKEVKRKLERVETEDEKPVSESINVISNGLKKVGMERQKTNDVSEEDKTRNLINGDDFIKVDRPMKKSESDNLSNSVNSKPLTVILPDESELNVPKTPTPTPTRISMEISLENPHSEKTYISQEKIVLNSLECAKKKLMAVNDDSVEAFEDEETMFAQQKVDFHAEDIQQESEYTEHYDIATQRHLDSLTKSESFESSPLTNSSIEDDESKCRQAVAFAKAESASHLSLQNKDPEEEGRLGTPPRPGTIAEREHKKWENAPPIENNPYSQENIQKRLLERQYSRRSSDIPGIHTELPKSNGADMDVVLAPHEPDIKRFGRDYYINDSRASGNEKGRRSTASTSSRPSSSLSQRSSSNGMADQDQQVSFQLEKFEEASLRGSLSRWTYRDPYSSPQFAINPLLRLELDVSTEPTDRDHENINGSNENSTGNDVPNGIEYSKNMTKNKEHIDKYKAIIEKETKYFDIDGQDAKSLGTDNDILKLMSSEFSQKVAYNPLYEPEKSILKSDDSGMFSVDMNPMENNKKQSEEFWRLWINDNQDHTRNDQILSFNGRRYWNLNGYKYHTFGGIKNSLDKSVEDSDAEDNLKMETRDDDPFDITDFSKFKFQTFGGIKKGKKIDGKGIPMYRKMILRSCIRNCKNTKGMRSSQSDSALQRMNGINNASNEKIDQGSDRQSDYESDSPEERDTMKYLNINTKRKRNNKFYKRRVKTVFSSYRSSSDESWQDEDVQSPDKLITRKCLRDTPKKTKLRPNPDNDSNYFFNTSRRKVFNDSLRRVRSQKRLSDDNESLKLEPPIVPQMVEKTFETLQDLRSKGKKKKSKSFESNNLKKTGVRCLTDLTIW
ncbi:titin homolog isoform X5 [Bombus flavifrons]|uniref:titin homolog isoform X5 n=1 Tax=Bombus flavifrons TaxID=103934 RepID=UPI00370457F2